MLKQLRLLAATALLSAPAFAATFNVTTSGLTYSPNMVMAQVGDTVNFSADFSFHPTVQVTEATWNNNASTPMTGGFSFTSGNTGTVVITSANDIYFVCRNHVGSGMKGMIMVSEATGVKGSLATLAAPYPNPARAELTLPAGLAAGQALITTPVGQPVLRQSFAAGQTRLPLTGLPAGSYLLQLPGRSYRFVKE